MATGTIAPFPFHQWLTNAGAPAASYRLFTYDAGTSTKVSVWTTSAMSVAHSNPLTLDSSGRPTSPIYLAPGSSYKFVMALPGSDDPPSSPIWTCDNIEAVPNLPQSEEVEALYGEGLNSGQAAYLADGSGGTTAGRWYTTDADNAYSSVSAGKIGIVAISGSTGATGVITTGGRATIGSGAIVAGSEYFLSATAGDITTSAPSQPRYARQIGVGDTINTIILTPERSFSAAKGGVGYSAGAGDSVAQITSKSTAVAIDRQTGAITMNNANLNAGTLVSFTVNNIYVLAEDSVIVNHASAGTSAGYAVSAHTIAAGSFVISVTNITGGNLAEAIVIKFTLIKGANS